MDHLVIGPAGVFAVRATNCTDQDVIVDGDSLVVDGEIRGDVECSRADATSVAGCSPGDRRNRAGSSLLVVVDAARLGAATGEQVGS